ncbi:MAG: UbiA family prenyltransferase, partial [Pseudomonadota bacterium]
MAPEPGFRDYVRLLKPRVMSLVIFTAIAGMLAAPSAPHPVIAFAALICIAVGAGAAGALNMWYDADIDAEMDRTRGRPVPAAGVEPETARDIGIGLSLLSVAMLGVVANPAAAAMLATERSERPMPMSRAVSGSTPAAGTGRPRVRS